MPGKPEHYNDSAFAPNALCVSRPLRPCTVSSTWRCRAINKHATSKICCTRDSRGSCHYLSRTMIVHVVAKARTNQRFRSQQAAIVLPSPRPKNKKATRSCFFADSPFALALAHPPKHVQFSDRGWTSCVAGLLLETGSVPRTRLRALSALHYLLPRTRQRRCRFPIVVIRCSSQS
jgi:hypothetical protein